MDTYKEQTGIPSVGVACILQPPGAASAIDECMATDRHCAVEFDLVWVFSVRARGHTIHGEEEYILLGSDHWAGQVGGQCQDAAGDDPHSGHRYVHAV